MIVVAVAAAPDDAARAALVAPPGVLFVNAGTAEAEAADVVLYASGGREALAAALASSPRLRWIHVLSAGLDGILVPELRERGVPLTNARGAYSAALGEFAIAGLLHFLRGVPRLRRAQDERRWETFEPLPLAGRVVGILGYGDIGAAVAARAKPFGVRLVGLRRRPEGVSDPLLERLHGPGELDAFLDGLDDLVLCLPLTPETRGVVGARELVRLRPGAVVVNVGRGAVLDEAALLDALRSGQVRGAALDVFAEEPLPPDHPFWGMDSVLVSPHCADNVPGWREGSVRVFLENLARFQAGEPLRNVVDPARGY